MAGCGSYFEVENVGFQFLSLRRHIKWPFFLQGETLFVWPIAALVLGRTHGCPDLEITFFVASAAAA